MTEQDADEKSNEGSLHDEGDLRDEEPDSPTPAQDTIIRRTTERFKLEIFPNWPLSAPPMFTWGKNRCGADGKRSSIRAFLSVVLQTSGTMI